MIFTTSWDKKLKIFQREFSGTAIKKPVPDRVKPSFVIFDIRHSGTQGWASECPDVKNYKWKLHPVWHRMLYSCTHMATYYTEAVVQPDICVVQRQLAVWLDAGWLASIQCGPSRSRLGSLSAVHGVCSADDERDAGVLSQSQHSSDGDLRHERVLRWVWWCAPVSDLECSVSVSECSSVSELGLCSIAIMIAICRRVVTLIAVDH